MTQFWLTLDLPWLTLIAADGLAAVECDVIRIEWLATGLEATRED